MAGSSYIRRPGRDESPRIAAPVPDWSKLCRNDHVEVYFPGGAPVIGTIDMIAPDHSVFWMIRHDGAGRTMLCFGDNVDVIKVPALKE